MRQSHHIFVAFIIHIVFVGNLCASEDTARGGVVTALNDLVVSAPLGGVIKTMNFELGQEFKKDDVLVTFECAAQKAETSAAKAQHQKAQAEWKVAREGLSNRITSQTAVNLAGYDVAEKKSILWRSIVRQKECTVKASFDGEVVEKHYSPAEYVQVGTPLLRICDTKGLYIKMNVPESDWNRFYIDSEHNVEIDVLKKKLVAKVSTRSNYIGKNQYFLVQLNFRGNLKSITPGMRVVVR